jgi:hypothetical protein
MIESQGIDMDTVQLKINQNMQSKHISVQTFKVLTMFLFKTIIQIVTSFQKFACCLPNNSLYAYNYLITSTIVST